MVKFKPCFEIGCPDPSVMLQRRPIRDSKGTGRNVKFASSRQIHHNKLWESIVPVGLVISVE